MKAGLSLSEMAAEITRQNATKRDFKAPTPQIAYVPGESKERLNVRVGGEAFHPTDNFHNQIGAWAKIPAPYYDRMLETAPDLLAQNVNHWLDKTKETRLVRTLDGNARAFLSNRYRTIDNQQIAEAVLPFIMERSNDLDLNIESCNVSPTQLFIKVFSRRLEAKVVGDTVQAGICISNSEVGLHSFRVEEMSMVLSCLNGAVRPDNSMRKYHVGRNSGDTESAFEVFADDTRKADDRALMLKMRDVVKAAFDSKRFEQFASSITAISRNKITREASTAVESVVEMFRLPESYASPILDLLAKKYDSTQWGLANAITEFAQSDTLDYAQATNLERVGGAVIELAKSDWEKVAA
jgi:Domain of unknown function (DUF932)